MNPCADAELFFWKAPWWIEDTPNGIRPSSPTDAEPAHTDAELAHQLVGCSRPNFEVRVGPSPSPESRVFRVRLPFNLKLVDANLEPRVTFNFEPAAPVTCSRSPAHRTLPLPAAFQPVWGLPPHWATRAGPGRPGRGLNPLSLCATSVNFIATL